jgi:hypothetical protein
VVGDFEKHVEQFPEERSEVTDLACGLHVQGGRRDPFESHEAADVLVALARSALCVSSPRFLALGHLDLRLTEAWGIEETVGDVRSSRSAFEGSSAGTVLKESVAG